MLNKQYIVSILFLFSASLSLAQGRFYAKGASSTYIDEPYKIVFVLENTAGSKFEGPSFDGFKVLEGPYQGSSYQNNNGRVTQSINVFYYIQALKEGNLVIGPASVEINGERVYTEVVKVKVLPPKAKAPPPSQTQQNQVNPQNSDDWKKQIKDNVFVRMYTDNQQPYVGEQIFVYAKIYLRMDIYGTQVTDMPDFQGFWKQELLVNSEEPKIEEYNGVQYHTYELAKYALFPLKEGKYTLNPIKMKSIVMISVPTVENFFGMQIRRMSYQQQEYEHASNALNITAKPLPSANKPLDFIGAVGKFKLESYLDSTEIEFGGAIKLNTTISGAGNIMSIQEPIFQFPRQLEVFDPIIKENISKNSNYIKGSKSFEYIIVPERPGTFTIPSTQFSYFDTETETYISLSSPNFEINVTGELPKALAEENATDTLYENPFDLYEIAKTYDIHSQADTLYGSFIYYTGLASPVLIYLFFIFGVKLKENFQVDLVALKNKRASKEAQKRLKKAKEFLLQSDKQKFYTEIFEAFNGYVSDKFNIEQALLSKELALEKFNQKNISTHLAEQFTQVLSNAEEALYSPASVSKMKEDYKAAIEWIVNVENEIT
jgi:hypothetical protein